MNTDGIEIPRSKINFNEIRLDPDLIINSNFLRKDPGLINSLPTKKNTDGDSTRLSQSLLASAVWEQRASLNTAFDAAVELAETKGDNSAALVKALESAREGAIEATRQTTSSKEDKLINFEKEPSFNFKLNEEINPISIQTPEQIEIKKEKFTRLVDDWVEVTGPIDNLYKKQPILGKTLKAPLFAAFLSLFSAK